MSLCGWIIWYKLLQIHQLHQLQWTPLEKKKSNISWPLTDQLLGNPVLITTVLRITWSYLEIPTSVDPNVSALTESDYSYPHLQYPTPMDSNGKQVLDQIIIILIFNLQLQWTPMVSNTLNRLLSASSTISNSKGLQWTPRYPMVSISSTHLTHYPLYGHRPVELLSP